MRKRPIDERFWEKVNKDGKEECWDWTAYKTADGYGRMGGIGRKILTAHRVSWELHNGPIPGEMCVCHSCDNPACVNPDHLWLGTHQDNMADRDEKGRHTPTSGERNRHAKLTENQVMAIRSEYPGTGQAELAEKYGVRRKTISKIICRELWAHI